MSTSRTSPFSGLRWRASISTAASAARTPLTPADLLSSRESEVALSEAEPRLLDAINSRGDAFVAGLAGHKSSARRVWRAIGLDPDGLDLAAGGSAARLAFSEPARDEASWRARFAEAARESDA